MNVIAVGFFFPSLSLLSVIETMSNETEYTSIK